jgi:ABC-type dipeptide/oligopeptide/nickel transport system permease subunit
MKRRKAVHPKKTTNEATRKASSKEDTASSTSPMIAAASALVGKLQSHMAGPNGTANIFRTFLMVAMVAWVTTDRRVREKVRNFLIMCWIKLSRTVGMGMKVTYI